MGKFGPKMDKFALNMRRKVNIFGHCAVLKKFKIGVPIKGELHSGLVHSVAAYNGYGFSVGKK